MYFSSLNIPFGVTCILAICATGHPLQNSGTGIEARLPGFGTKGELGVETRFRTQDHSRKAGDLILEILFTNNYDEDIQLLEDKDSVLYSGGPVDVLSWTSSTVGVLPTFKGDSESSDDAELELDTQLNKDPKKVHIAIKKGDSYTFQYHVGDSYNFRNVAAGHYTAEFRQTQFWISIGGKEVEAKVNLERIMMPIELEGQGSQGPSGAQ